MAQVIVGIGSHIDRERHITACLDALKAEFGELRISRIFENRFEGESISTEVSHAVYNLVVAFDSRALVGDLKAWCKSVERANGRTDQGPVTLDIDLLCVGDLVGIIDGVSLPHDDILRFAFVLKPLADLLPNAHHPVNGQRYAELWASVDSGGQSLRPVDFTWRRKVISRAN
ncbi:2-amino-4-hydroxy-6-hydroxymethyldihydropteridine diphosphokinase [Halomonas sp. M20]|uniref:2-amino-4-hydroxy-6- hydroxymethyldihydropteridine diphosphokinase n=1 Tax=Halomonas sp. M20 TaxID=2763264 RepID=UPI001D0ABBEB|nr:2-amino-4-hydroxy-6-hydroxymethyldihydropteridine diphosphokinase [Halomonas sp. M20]